MSRWHKNDWDFLPEKAFSPRPCGGMTFEGGKGGGTPPPDPALIQAQINSMGIQDDAIKRVLANSDRLAPLQEEQMRFALDANRRAFEQSQADREYSLERRAALTGLQNKLVDEANAFNTDARREEIASQAGADVEQAFAAQRGSTARQMARMGINPNSGKFAAMTGQMDVAQAAAKAGAANTARTAARAEGRALTDRATNALAGYPAMGMQSTGQGAQLAASGINLANAGTQGMNAGWGAASTMAGQMGQNATNMWGQQANAYNQSNQGESLGGILGGLGGMMLGLGKNGLGLSDRRLKQDIVLVGKDVASGLNLYEFAYIKDPGRRFVGVMADEVQAVMPDAVIEVGGGFLAVDYAMLGIEMEEVS